MELDRQLGSRRDLRSVGGGEVSLGSLWCWDDVQPVHRGSDLSFRCVRRLVVWSGKVQSPPVRGGRAGIAVALRCGLVLRSLLDVLRLSGLGAARPAAG